MAPSRCAAEIIGIAVTTNAGKITRHNRNLKASETRFILFSRAQFSRGSAKNSVVISQQTDRHIYTEGPRRRTILFCVARRPQWCREEFLKSHKTKRPATCAAGRSKPLGYVLSLPASATGKSTSATNSASAVESATTMHFASAMESANRTTNDWPVPEASKSRSADEARAPIESMEPRTRADKDAAAKPTRSVVAVRRARVRSIRVVAVGADRSAHHKGRRRADPHSNHDPLRMRERSRNQASAKHRENS